MAGPTQIKQGGAQNQEQQGPKRTASKELSPAGAGDDRTPDKTIGQVKYADKKLAEKSEKEGPAAYAPQGGDDRTPDEPIGEVVYANRGPAKKTGA